MSLDDYKEKVSDYTNRLNGIESYSGQKKYDAASDLFSDIAGDVIGSIFNGIKGLFDNHQQKKLEAKRLEMERKAEVERIEQERRAEAERLERIRIELIRRRQIAKRRRVLILKALIVLLIIALTIAFVYFGVIKNNLFRADLENIESFIKRFFGTILSAVKEWFLSVFNVIKNIVNSVIEFFGMVFSVVKD
jgi:hypothetical protein